MTFLYSFVFHSYPAVFAVEDFGVDADGYYLTLKLCIITIVINVYNQPNDHQSLSID